MDYYVIIVTGERSTSFAHESLNPGKRNHGFAKGEGGGKIAKMHIIISARYKKVSC